MCFHELIIKENEERAALGAQWWRTQLQRQETGVQPLVQEDPTCLGATVPVHHHC